MARPEIHAGRRWIPVAAFLLAVLVVAVLRHRWSSAPGWVDASYGVLVAVALFASLGGIGATCLPAVLGAAQPRDRLTRSALSVVLGTGIVTLLLIAYGVLLGHMRGSGVVVLAVGLPLAIVRWRPRRGAIRLRRVQVAGLALLLLFLLPYGWRLLAPAGDWDSASCHLPTAWRFLSAGPWFDTPDLQLLYRPGNAHVVYAALLSLGAESAIVPLNALFVLLGAALVYAVAYVTWGRRAGYWGIGVYLTSSILLELGLDARVEPFLVVAFLAGAWGLFRYLRADRPRSTLLWTLGAAGYAVGVKYSGLPVAGLLAVAAASLLLFAGRAERLRRGGLGLTALLLLIVPSGIWYLRNAAVWGDATYPFGDGTKVRVAGRVEPLRDLLDGAPAWVQDAEGAQALEREAEQSGTAMRRAGEERLLLHWGLAVFSPEEFSPRKRHGMSPLLLLLPLVLLLRPRGPAVLLVGLCVAGMLWLGWSRPVLRYQMPFLALASAGVGALFARVPGRRYGIALAVLVAIAAALPWRASWKAARKLEASAYLAGRRSKAEHLAHTGHNGSLALARAALFLDRAVESGQVAAADEVWMVGEGKTNAVPIEAHPSPGIDGRDFLHELRRHDWDVERMRAALWARGHRWFLVNEDYFAWTLVNSRVNPDYLAAVRRGVARFTETCCGPPVYDELELRIWPLLPTR